MSFRNTLSANMIPCCTISIVIGMLLLSLFFFHFNKLFKTRYLQLVFYVQLSDLCLSFGGIIGAQRAGTFGCGYQYIMTNFFPVCSCLLSLITMRELYYVIFLGKTVDEHQFKRSCMAAVIVPLIVTLLPLSTEDIGPVASTAGDDDAYGWCFLMSGESVASWLLPFWLLICFYLWVWLSVICMITIVVMLYFKIKNMESKSLQDHCKLSLYKLLCYPVLNGIGWITSAVYDYKLTTGQVVKISKGLAFLKFGCPFLLGTITSIAFILTNQRLTRKWSKDFFVYLGITSSDSNWNVDDNYTAFNHTVLPSTSPSPSGERAHVNNAQIELENMNESGNEGVWRDTGDYNEKENEATVESPIHVHPG